jgi:hypothetical protein
MPPAIVIPAPTGDRLSAMQERLHHSSIAVTAKFYAHVTRGCSAFSHWES